MQARLSFLWIFVLFNMLFRDMHDLFRSGVLQQMQSGVVDGVTITEELMLISVFVVEIPIVMVFLSCVLRQRVNRLANVIVAHLTNLLTFTYGARDMDDIFFMVVVMAALLSIATLAWKWHNPESNDNKTDSMEAQ